LIWNGYVSRPYSLEDAEAAPIAVALAEVADTHNPKMRVGSIPIVTGSADKHKEFPGKVPAIGRVPHPAVRLLAGALV
jgi:hypothetical protein